MKTYSSIPDLKEKKEKVLCPLCGHNLYKPLWKVGTSTFVRCRNCRMVYQNPRPFSPDLQERYGEEYFQYEVNNQNAFLQLMLQSFKDMEFSLEEGKGRRFLDIGCATGALLEAAKQQGWQAQGIEICPQSVSYAREVRGVEVFLGSLEQWDSTKEELDVIHSSHVIEHVTDPGYFVRRSWELLKKGGDLFCTTPNIDGFQARLFGASWRSAIEDHVSLFSKKHLIKLFQQEGFQILQTKTWGGLAAGTSPLWLKKIADPLAKAIGIGDVVIIHARKN